MNTPHVADNIELRGWQLSTSPDGTKLYVSRNDAPGFVQVCTDFAGLSVVFAVESDSVTWSD